MALIETYTPEKQQLYLVPALVVPDYIDTDVSALFRDKIAPFYNQPESADDLALLFSAQRISLYQGAGNTPEHGTSLYATHADKKEVYMTASFDNSGKSLETCTVSRTPHRSELTLVAAAMKEIRVNLPSFVQEFSIDPLTLLSSLPSRKKSS